MAPERDRQGLDKSLCPCYHELVSHTIYESTIGQFFITADDKGLCQSGFLDSSKDRFLEQLGSSEQKVNSTLQKNYLDLATSQLDEYFQGKRQTFDIPLNFCIKGSFYQNVLDTLRYVPYGTTLSYKSLARLAGRPKAIRAAGTACSLNPLPIFIGCHRVLKNNGQTGNYLGGQDKKKYLLDLESSYLSV